MGAAAIFRYLAVPARTAPLLLIGTFSVLLMVAFRARILGIPLGLYFAADWASHWIGNRGSLVLLIAVGAVLPAVVAVQGATNTVVQSLNPRRVLGLIARLRGDYLVILGFIAFVWLFARFVFDSAIGGALPLVVQVALLMYACLAVFALIGGVLFERRFDIGLDDVHTPESLDSGDDDGDTPDERTRDKEIDRIYAEWRGGAHANAWNTVLGIVGKSSDPIAELRWLYQRASQWPDGRLADRLARELLPRLLTQRNTGEALNLVRERLRKDPRFRPTGSADLLTLVHLARAGGDRATARLLLQDFSKLYPDDPAQAMVDRLNTQLQ